MGDVLSIGKFEHLLFDAIWVCLLCGLALISMDFTFRRHRPCQTHQSERQDHRGGAWLHSLQRIYDSGDLSCQGQKFLATFPRSARPIRVA